MKVFVSSTVTDLQPERTCIAEAVQALSMDAYVSEADGASWQSAYGKCFAEVEQCDVFVLVLGPRYGFVPPRRAGSEFYDGSTSVTHAEFKLAVKLNKPILVYVKRTSKREAAAAELLSQIEDFYAGHVRRTFGSVAQLSRHVKRDVLNVVTDIVRGTYRYPDLHPPTVVLCEDRNEVFAVGARLLCSVLDTERLPVLGLMPGRTAGGIYDALVPLLNGSSRLDALRRMRAFHVAEHFGVTGQSDLSYEKWMNLSLYSRLEKAYDVELNRETIHFIPGTVSDRNLPSECAKYDALVSSATIHLQLMGLAPNGQSMSVDPGLYDQKVLLDQRTTLVRISHKTFRYLYPPPPIRYCITIGMGNLLKFAKRIALLAFGADKATAVRSMLTTANCKEAPCSVLRAHSNLLLVLDKEAVSLLPARWPTFFPTVPAGDVLKDGPNQDAVLRT